MVTDAQLSAIEERNKMEQIRILIADDHAIVREGLKTLIESEPDLVLAGEAADGVELVKQVSETEADVILVDLIMPRMNGLDAIREIMGQNPNAHILVLTSFADDDKVFPAIKAGALGYLLKDSTPAQLIEAIHEVYRGESSLHASIALKLIRELKQPADLPPTEKPLTGREVEVIKLVARGMSNQEIADALTLSEGTVRTHVRNIMAKLHLANRTQAALYALKEGLAHLE